MQQKLKEIYDTNPKTALNLPLGKLGMSRALIAGLDTVLSLDLGTSPNTSNGFSLHTTIRLSKSGKYFPIFPTILPYLSSLPSPCATFDRLHQSIPKMHLRPILKTHNRFEETDGFDLGFPQRDADTKAVGNIESDNKSAVLDGH